MDYHSPYTSGSWEKKAERTTWWDVACWAAIAATVFCILWMMTQAASIESFRDEVSLNENLPHGQRVEIYRVGPKTFEEIGDRP